MSRKKTNLKEKEWDYLCNHISKQRIADELDKQEATCEWKKKYPEDKRIKVIFKEQPEIYNEELMLRNDSLYLGYDFTNKKWLAPNDIKDIDVKAGFKIGDALRLRSLLEKRVKRKD